MLEHSATREKSVLVAMSGGVDSTVSAFLLKEQGYRVEGVTFNLFKQENPQHIRDAKNACDILGIPHHVLHLEEVFQKKIMDYFTETYLSGKTPNPCIFCNPYIKFAFLTKKADELDIYHIATGHYSSVTQTAQGPRVQGSFDTKKSQEYFLALLPADVLSRILFPLAEYEKTEVREIATKNALGFFGKKPDSQEICFLQDKKYTDFLQQQKQTPKEEGSIIDLDTQKVVGKHQGFYHYTLGQRRGIGVGLGSPRYVSHIDAKKNEIYIGDAKSIQKKRILAKVINLLEDLDLSQPYIGKIRYKSQPQEIRILSFDQESKMLLVEAVEFFSAPSQGQILVLYNQ